MNPSEAYWREMGLWPQWTLRAPASGGACKPEAESSAGAPAVDWDALREQVGACRQCALHEQRKQAVFGMGDERAAWLFVGEGPGAEEDQQGLPFVGAAGKLLDQMLLAMGLQRGKDVYIANVVKCRPPQNRTPTHEECQSCLPYLRRQIELVQPKLIVTLGKVAAQALLGTDEPVGALRKRSHQYGALPLVATWHPAYLLRSPGEKAKAWEDLCRARRLMKSLCSPDDGTVGTATT